MFVAMLSLGEAIWSPRWYGELLSQLPGPCGIYSSRLPPGAD